MFFALIMHPHISMKCCRALKLNFYQQEHERVLRWKSLLYYNLRYNTVLCLQVKTPSISTYHILVQDQNKSLLYPTDPQWGCLQNDRMAWGGIPFSMAPPGLRNQVIICQCYVYSANPKWPKIHECSFKTASVQPCWLTIASDLI